MVMASRLVPCIMEGSVQSAPIILLAVSRACHLLASLEIGVICVTVVGVVCMPLYPLAVGMGGILLVGRDTVTEGIWSKLLIPSSSISPVEVRLSDMEVTACETHEVAPVGMTVC